MEARLEVRHAWAWAWSGRMHGDGGGGVDGLVGEERWIGCDGKTYKRRGRVSGSESVSGGVVAALVN